MRLSCILLSRSCNRQDTVCTQSAGIVAPHYEAAGSGASFMPRTTPMPAHRAASRWPAGASTDRALCTLVA